MPKIALTPDEKARREADQKAARMARYREKTADRPTARDVDRAMSTAFVMFLRELVGKKTRYSQEAHDNLNRKIRSMATEHLGGGEVAAHAVDVRLAGIAWLEGDGA